MRKSKLVLWVFLTWLLLPSCIKDTETFTNIQVTAQSGFPVPFPEASEIPQVTITTEVVFNNASPAFETGSPVSIPEASEIPQVTITAEAVSTNPTSPPRVPDSTMTLPPTFQATFTPTQVDGLELKNTEVYQDRIVLMWDFQGKSETPDNQTWYALEVYREGDYSNQLVNRYWLNSGVYEIRSISKGNYTWKVMVYRGDYPEGQIEMVLIEEFGVLNVPSDINPPHSQTPLPPYPPPAPTREPNPTIEPTPTNIPYP